jgi:hypothetical protein
MGLLRQETSRFGKCYDVDVVDRNLSFILVFSGDLMWLFDFRRGHIVLVPFSDYPQSCPKGRIKVSTATLKT